MSLVSPILWHHDCYILPAPLQTDYEGQAKKLMEFMEKTDMLIVAGGDGTLQEVITGLLRRPDQVGGTQASCFGLTVTGLNVFFSSVTDEWFVAAGNTQQHTDWIHSTGLPQFPESKSSSPQWQQGQVSISSVSYQKIQMCRGCVSLIKSVHFSETLHRQHCPFWREKLFLWMCYK